MKITPRDTGGIPLLDISYKYNVSKVLGFIVTEWALITAPGVSYLSRLPDIYCNVSICPVVCLHLLCRHFNACNAIDNNNRMPQYYIALEKYWVT